MQTTKCPKCGMENYAGIVIPSWLVIDENFHGPYHRKPLAHEEVTKLLPSTYSEDSITVCLRSGCDFQGTFSEFRSS